MGYEISTIIGVILKFLIFPFKLFLLYLKNIWRKYSPFMNDDDFEFEGYVHPQYQEVADLYKSYFKLG